MTGPNESRYESHIDKQIRAAQERGDFDDLPGMGKPLPGEGEHLSEDWWLKRWVEREKLTGLLPPSLALRKEVEQLEQTVAGKREEAAVRAVVADLNERITRANRGLLDGPPVVLPAVDADEVVRVWRNRRV